MKKKLFLLLVLLLFSTGLVYGIDLCSSCFPIPCFEDSGCGWNCPDGCDGDPCNYFSGDYDDDGYDYILCGGTDCNDAEFLINPGITEVCDDGFDNNCNLAIDCADSQCSSHPSCVDNPICVNECPYITWYCLDSDTAEICGPNGDIDECLEIYYWECEGAEHCENGVCILNGNGDGCTQNSDCLSNKCCETDLGKECRNLCDGDVSPGPCQIETVTWGGNPVEITENEIITISVTSSGACNGEPLNIKIFRDELTPPYTNISSNTGLTTNFNSNGEVTINWPVIWPEGIKNDLNPEYFIRATYNGKQKKSESVPVKPNCGNDELRGSEVCDDGLLNGVYGYCNKQCTAIKECGDGILQSYFELCDGINLNGKTCIDLGFSGGELSCTETCIFDFNNCEIPDHCTNNVQDDDETGVDCGGSCPACPVEACSFTQAYWNPSENVDEGENVALNLITNNKCEGETVKFNIYLSETDELVFESKTFNIEGNKAIYSWTAAHYYYDESRYDYYFIASLTDSMSLKTKIQSEDLTVIGSNCLEYYKCDEESLKWKPCLDGTQTRTPKCIEIDIDTTPLRCKNYHPVTEKACLIQDFPFFNWFNVLLVLFIITGFYTVRGKYL